MNLPNRLRRRLVVAGLLSGPLALGACASPAIDDYASERPILDLKRYFDGEVLAHGIFVDRAGRVARRFTVVMSCTWRGEEGELDERFSYSDGASERRVWRLRHVGGGRYVGRADDVVGEASGRTVGNSFRWAYTLRLPVDGRVRDVQFDDWMHLVDERVMLNRATMSKFGFRLGEVQLVFTRATPMRAAGEPGGSSEASGMFALPRARAPGRPAGTVRG
ncbi:MAG: DUF3833 domain-containing protein [Rubrivivax sp.]|nr:DUF3833 domain-containing protein [Rubrivivax sp.]